MLSHRSLQTLKEAHETKEYHTLSIFEDLLVESPDSTTHLHHTAGTLLRGYVDLPTAGTSLLRVLLLSS